MEKLLIMCEGPNEKEIIKILLENDLLKFTEDDLLGLTPYHARQIKSSGQVKTELNIYPGQVRILRIGDKQSDKLVIPSEYKDKILSVDKYCTKPELEMLSDALSNEMQIIVDRRKELYALRREQPSEPLNADIDALTAQLRPLRRELRLCGKIVEYAPRMLRQVQESTSPSTENHLPNKAKERLTIKSQVKKSKNL